MLNIVVSQNGNVTGDKGKIIAYEGQLYSEVINIVHPLFPGATYYIEYKYDNTILRNELDASNHVSIKIENAGYIVCQFIAIDILTGDILFKSKQWSLIINEALKIEESHYPCHSVNHHYKHREPTIIAHSSHDCDNKCNNEFKMIENYKKLLDRISNEEDVRFNEMQSIRQELAEIKAAIGINDGFVSTLNADDILIVGTYNANTLSTGFPKKNMEYTLTVCYYDDENVLQIAYEKNSNDTYYRSTLSNNAAGPVWNDWTLLTL